MFHLIIEQGKDVGREITVPANGMKFGRSPANDLVLDDEAVMLFHGRFFFKSDGTLWITDFGAGEKTVVEGVPVDEYQLKMGELVEVGKTAFRVINVKQEDEEFAPVLPPEDPSSSIDLGFKKDRTTRTARKANHNTSSHHLIPRVLQVLVVVLVLIVGFVLFSLIRDLFDSDSSGKKTRRLLLISYERVQASTNNIFRYHLTLDSHGKFILDIDDLKNKRHIQKEKIVPKVLLRQLADEIEESGFFQLNSDFTGSEEGVYDLYNLAIYKDASFNQIRILNRNPPPEIKRVVASIENFALDELKIPLTLFKDNDELMAYARIAVKLGNSNYKERDVSYSNLADAIAEYKKAMLALETFEPKPNLYRIAEKGLGRAELEQDKRYKDYMFLADQAVTLNDWDKAIKYLRILSQLIPDRSDKRYEKIKRMLIKVEARLR